MPRGKYVRVVRKEAVTVIQMLVTADELLDLRAHYGGKHGLAARIRDDVVSRIRKDRVARGSKGPDAPLSVMTHSSFLREVFAKFGPQAGRGTGPESVEPEPETPDTDFLREITQNQAKLNSEE